MVEFVTYKPSEDLRGYSFLLDDDIAKFIQAVRNLHVSTVLPGKIRGNHFHTKKREILFAMPGCRWLIAWDQGKHTAIKEQTFSGETAVLVKIAPLSSHAVKNVDKKDLVLLSMGKERYNPEDPDAQTRIVLDGMA